MKPYTKIIPSNSILRWNCVFWVRSKVSKLPFGLFTFEQKTAIVNSQKAEIGKVAIIKTKQKWGHVALVTFVGKRHITIQEANFYSGKISERHGPPASLRIAGYYS